MKLAPAGLISLRLLLIPLALLLISLPACQTASPEYLVTRVVDGDTIVLAGGQRVRYIGINAPELTEPLGAISREANRALVDGQRVSLEKDVSETDRYRRLLRYVYVGGRMVNGELVRLGLARAQAYPPDTKYQDYLKRLEAEARREGRGIWAK